ncbi:MAG: IS1595 family transposase [Acidobacteriota bacterium]|nr:IS1595 family transposase [Acidobacteriota bacterium]
MGDVQGRNNILNKAQKYTVEDFNREFPTDDACLEYVKEQRWSDGITACTKCGVDRKHYRVTGRTAYACDHCGNHIYPLAGTIFEKSTTSLRLWFYAMYLMGATKCGISAKQVQRETGVTYKTAWRMFKQIRTLMGEEISLEGYSVEADEAYFGGVRKGQHGRLMTGDHDKTGVMGMVERKTNGGKGRVVARTIENAKSKTLLDNVKKYVMPLSTIYTDEAKAYQGIGSMSKFYEHKRINHSAGVYVMGDVHTNTIEGFWSLVKRGIGGTHHMVSAKFLQEYLNEYAFRYNRRDVARPMFKLILEQVSERAE